MLKGPSWLIQAQHSMRGHEQLLWVGHCVEADGMW